MLIEAFTVGRSEDHFVIVAFGLEGSDATVYRFALHHHSGTAAVGIVIHAAPFVEGVVSQVMQANLRQSFFLGTCQDRLVDEALEHFRQYGYNVDSHIS